MFKRGNVADEVCSAMETKLISLQLEQNHGFNKLAKVADLLNAAASLFEQANMIEEAKEVEQVMESLVNNLGNVP